MKTLSEDEAKALASEYLDSDHIKNPKEEITKAEELCNFWFWNPPTFTEGQPDHWGEWKVFRLIDPETDDEGRDKMSVDMARYFVERSETDRDYWDALRLILAKKLDRSGSIEDPYLCGWLIDCLADKRQAPPKKPGNPARKYHARDGDIYFAMQALSDDGPMSESEAAAAAWVGEHINLSREAIRTIYQKAQKAPHPVRP